MPFCGYGSKQSSRKPTISTKMVWLANEMQDKKSLPDSKKKVDYTRKDLQKLMDGLVHRFGFMQVADCLDNSGELEVS